MHREKIISNYLLAGFSAVSLVLMSLPLSAPVRSLKACLAYAFNPVAYHGAHAIERFEGVPAGIRRLIMAEIQNQALLAEMRQWALVRAEAETLRRENERLRAAVGLKAPDGALGVWAHVMERDPAHWYHSLSVDVGRDADVAINAPVLGQRGDRLVALGRVTEVGPNSSKILLLTDELSSAAAYLSSGPVEGLVQGQGRERLLMNYIHSEAKVAEGDEVLTSATSATFPPDVLIGRVSRVFPRDPFLTFQSVEVKPAAEASAFSEVVIVKRRPAAAARGAEPPQ